MEDTKEVIRSRKSKDSQTIQWPRKAQKTKDKQNLQNNSHKYEDSMTRTPLKTGADSGAPKRSASMTRTPLKTGADSGAPKRSVVPAPLVPPVELLLLNIQW